MPRHLVIFARYPRLGTGKRRLAKDIGAVQVLKFQRVMLARLLRRLGCNHRWTTWLAITPDRSGPWPRGFSTLRQGQGDLGRRLASVFRSLPPGPALVIGADIPDITAADIAEAFRALGSSDAVFGPATDGGYWLVGLRRRPHRLDPFAGVRWSSEHALADTLANLSHSKVAMLRPLADIDDGVSWHRHAAKAAAR